MSQLALRGRFGQSLIEPQWKVIVREDEGYEFYPELFDRLGDPEERHNLGASDSILAHYLATKLRAKSATSKSMTEVDEVDAEDMEELSKALKALGYIQ